MIAVTQGETTDIPPHLQSWFEGNEEKTGQRAFWLAFIDTQIDPTVAPRERMFEGFRFDKDIPKFTRQITPKATMYGILNGFVRCLVYCKYIPLRERELT